MPVNFCLKYLHACLTFLAWCDCASWFKTAPAAWHASMQAQAISFNGIPADLKFPARLTPATSVADAYKLV